MNANLQKLIDILCEIRNASVRITPDTIRETMKEYDMLFVGSKCNTIFSIELHHSLKTKFNIDIAMTDLNTLIPVACKTLNMSFEELVQVKDIGKPNPNISYKITLWE